MGTPIRHPADLSLTQLCSYLRQRATQLRGCEDWPADQLRACGEAGVYEWFLPQRWAGQEWSAGDICRGYLELSRACLTTTFVITQFMGACQRIAQSGNPSVAEQWLPLLRTGKRFATVGISHLTTSRRYLAEPVLEARQAPDGYILDGYSPWVTGACHADLLVVGATLADGRQILCAVPTAAEGVDIPAPRQLLALSASCTGSVEFHQVHVPDEWVLAGPAAEVMKSGMGAGTGGVQTSVLALGLARAALDFLDEETTRRADLLPPVQALDRQWQSLREEAILVAQGTGGMTAEALRAEANSLVLRATQAALTAAKGAGFVEGHPAGRWCREALFFLVWSCPQNVLHTHLCQLAGLT